MGKPWEVVWGVVWGECDDADDKVSTEPLNKYTVRFFSPGSDLRGIHQIKPSARPHGGVRGVAR